MGNQIGPRQFEFPPKMYVSDSAGEYRTVYSSSPTRPASGASS